MWRALGRLSASQRAEVGAMVAVTAVAVGTLLDSATSEPIASDAARTAAYGPSHGMKLDFAQVARDIRQGRVVVIDQVLDATELRAARRDVSALHDEGDRFHNNANADDSVRRDQVYWVTGKEEGVGQGLKHAVDLLRGLAHELGQTQAFDKASFFVQTTAQLACYAGNGRAHYSAHKDASDESLWALGLTAWLRARAYRERAVTAILYLNDRDWDADAKGGCLRCYLEKGGEPHGAAATTAADSNGGDESNQLTVQDVVPSGGRLVLFDSKAILHEVLPSHEGTRRHALTVWISDRAARWAAW